MYNEFEIRELPLTIKVYRQRVERFLADNGLRIDDVDYYAGVFTLDDDILLAGGGLSGNVIKCIAVNHELRDEGLSNRLVSHLISVANSRGHRSVKVFTKPENRHIFESLSFRLLAEAPKAILMETGNGLEEQMRVYRSLSLSPVSARSSYPLPSRNGIIIMNANPFTRGHRFLIEQASTQVERLFVMAVKEDRSQFSYDERLAMIKSGCQDLHNVIVLEGNDYAISAATFPTYFLKEESKREQCGACIDSAEREQVRPGGKEPTDASETQMRLDIDLFARHIAPALGIGIRFVGSEPTDALTRRYNELMKELLPAKNIAVMEIERLKDDIPVSASLLRKHLQEGSFSKALELAYPTTLPYLIAHLATRALQMELDTTPKPGLVDLHDNGAHNDMDYALMQKSINTLHPFFVSFSLIAYADSLPSHEAIHRLGILAEEIMMEATGGVNTHRGALFSMGLTIMAVSNMVYKKELTEETIQNTIKHIASSFPEAQGTHGSMVAKGVKVKGALTNAREGYAQLFHDWLPFYDSIRNEKYACHKTLLRIMATLDDTNIYHRAMAQFSESNGSVNTLQVKACVDDLKNEAADTLEHFSVEHLETMNRSFIQRNVSPGGCADMLSLTLFVHSIIH